MPITPERMTAWCRELLEGPAKDWDEYLAIIPDLDSLADLPAGTRVLVRGDVDATVTDGTVSDDVRLRSMLETLRFGRERGWVQIVFGHRGRDPELTLEPIARRLGELLGAEVPFLGEWMDDASGTVLDAVADTVARWSPGTLGVLQNTRRYSIETCLWKAKPADLPSLASRLARLANDAAEKLARVFVNEGFSASNRDASSTIIPATMDRVALGRYIAGELRGPVTRARGAELVVFSGLKINKLDDLEAILARGRVRMVIAAGSLAMALKKAESELDGYGFSMGRAGDPQFAHEKTYIPPERVTQSRGMLQRARRNNTEVVLPVDFMLADRSGGSGIGVSPVTSDTIPADGLQLDVGPKTLAHFHAALDRFIEFHRQKQRERGEPAIAFHNGVFGKFEDPKFETGTRRFVEELRRLHDAGVEVYVGGGEGGAAVEKYGKPDWVTHNFTAGGTILKALGSEPIPYLQAMAMAAR